jgi:hypothetical protein
MKISLSCQISLIAGGMILVGAEAKLPDLLGQDCPNIDR